MERVIVVKDLTKVYKGDVKAVDDISFSVAKGEVFGFLGPNGAGKTTTIKILTTLLTKTSGQVHVAGSEVAQNPTAIRRIIGYTSQDIQVDEDLTGRENLVLAGRIYHLPGKRIKQRVEELLDILGLKDASDRVAGTYSGGMRKRLDLATVLIHEPQILFLDEPTTGLDPQSRFAVWDYLQQLNEKGVTIFLTTQYMEEADRLCNKLAIIDFGKIVALGSPETLKGEVGANIVTVKIDAEPGKTEKQRLIAKEALETMPHISEIKFLDHDRLAAYVDNGSEAIPEIVRILGSRGILLGPVSYAESSLDDVFLKYTGHQLRVEEQKRKSHFHRLRRRRF